MVIFVDSNIKFREKRQKYTWRCLCACVRKQTKKEHIKNNLTGLWSIVEDYRALTLSIKEAWNNIKMEIQKDHINGRYVS